MDHSLFSPLGDALRTNQKTTQAILDLNERTAPYGLSLTDRDVKSLLHTRSLALDRSGRVEFVGAEVLMARLVEAFCDSPYLSQFDYASTLQDLLDLFYIAKTETQDKLADDELIAWMAEQFNGPCRGSLDLLCDGALQDLARGTCDPPADEDDLDWEDTDA